MSPGPPLNLASRPFRNERLPGLLFALALAGLLALTARHAALLAQLMPSRTAERHGQIAAFERELSDLRRESASLRRPDPDKATLTRWASVKDLVDRRTFAWTGLLARLETTLPRGVKLLSIAPDWQGGELRLALQATASNADQGFAFVKALEDQPDFEDVFPTQKTPGDTGVSFSYTMRYLPQAAPSPAPPVPEPAPGEDE